ncbi:MAG TPA: DHA2 family efflux MFS transporter permease subunit [Bryobacteraceae bacterium]|jgi:DHA2 family multidrug resistance protein|nr:DHA2 family efflux MFS transporter permease subunit [Bryobacteraceae bacterium]
MSEQTLEVAPPAPAQVLPWAPKHNPWIIALTVTLATFMEVLDTSIANVALPHIAGNLSAGLDESTWVLSSYLVANAVVLPISAWMAIQLGRKRFYMGCVVLFGISSLLCGLAPNLSMLIFFRVLQGLGGGGLAPSEQAILADTFPPAKRGMAFAIYGMAVVMAPAIGPTLGGYITDNFDWRWIFFINVPVAIISLILTSRLVEDPPYLKAAKQTTGRVDWQGLGLLAVGIGALQVVLDKGEREDWFSSSFINFFVITSVVCLVTAFFWELHHENPVIDIRLFRNRNFAVSCMMMFMLGLALFGGTVLIPQLVQTLMGYTAQQAGEVLSPGAIVIILMLPFVGIMVGKLDPRKLIAVGWTVAAAAMFYMTTTMNLGMSFREVILLRVYQMVGVAFLFVPIQTMCYVGIPPGKNNNVSGMTNLARNLGGSVGISLVTTLLARRGQVHQSYMAAHTSRYDPAFQAAVSGMAQSLKASGVQAAQATQMAYDRIYGAMQAQASMLAYLDTLWIFAIAAALMAPLAFLMKRAKPGSGPAAMH